MVEHIDAVVHTSEDLLAGTLRKDWHIGQAVYALCGVGGKGAIDDEAIGVVFWVDEIVGGWEPGDVGGRQARTVLLRVSGCRHVRR